MVLARQTGLTDHAKSNKERCRTTTVERSTSADQKTRADDTGESHHGEMAILEAALYARVGVDCALGAAGVGAIPCGNGLVIDLVGAVALTGYRVVIFQALGQRLIVHGVRLRDLVSRRVNDSVGRRGIMVQDEGKLPREGGEKRKGARGEGRGRIRGCRNQAGHRVCASDTAATAAAQNAAHTVAARQLSFMALGRQDAKLRMAIWRGSGSLDLGV